MWLLGKHYHRKMDDAGKQHFIKNCIIHKNLKEIDIIGWDIVISGNDYYFLEGNIFEGAANPHEKGYVKNAKDVLKCVKLNN